LLLQVNNKWKMGKECISLSLTCFQKFRSILKNEVRDNPYNNEENLGVLYVVMKQMNTVRTVIYGTIHMDSDRDKGYI